MAKKIIETDDNISILILLDMEDSGLINGTIDKTELEKELTGDILFNEKWLLAYEAVKKGWLSPVNPSLINDNEYFKILFDKDIEFYESSKQLSFFTKSSKSKE